MTQPNYSVSGPPLVLNEEAQDDWYRQAAAPILAPPVAAGPPEVLQSFQPPPDPPPPPPDPPGVAGNLGMQAEREKRRIEDLTTPALVNPPPPRPPPGPFEFKKVSGGGVVPAHEAAIRGPQQNAALMGAFDVQQEAAARSAARSQEQALSEERAYQEEADDALARRDAIAAAQAKRSAEMERLQYDFETSVEKLGEMKLDSNRLWGSMSTGEKIGNLLMVGLGGLFKGTTGGKNAVYDALQQEIRDDVESQKFAYQAGLDQVRGRQTAFSLAMQKYQNEDAAEAMARAAALDYATARAKQESAKWKGTNAANAGDDLTARLEADRKQTIAQGLKFVPAASTPARYAVSVNGQTLPYPVTGPEMNALVTKHVIEPGTKLAEEALKGDLALRGKLAEADDKARARVGEETRFIAEKLQSAGVPQMRALAEQAKASLAKSPGGIGDATARAIPGGGFLMDRASPDSAAREQAYQAFSNLNMNQLSGGAISPTEEARLKQQLGDASNPEARIRALDSVLEKLDAIEKSIKAGVSPEAQATYDKQRVAAGAGVPTAPTSAKPGWRDGR